MSTADIPVLSTADRPEVGSKFRVSGDPRIFEVCKEDEWVCCRGCVAAGAGNRRLCNSLPFCEETYFKEVTE